MADDVINLRYKGSPLSVGFFAQLLREEGLTVDYAMPQPTEEEQRLELWELTTVALAVTGPLWPAVWNAVKRFKGSDLGQEGEISGPPELELSTEDRLAILAP